MKKKEQPPADVGVLVGRFQVHELHEAHIDLIESVCYEHDKVIIFLGLSPLMVTQNNPLDFESRKQMLLKEFPEVTVLYIKDVNDDKAWSTRLDEQIGDVANPNQSVVLYGSRDSFISHYSGKFDTIELQQETFISGTEIRKSIGRKVKNTEEFRTGVIWAAFNQYPKVYPTVDVAILDKDESRVLLARKPFEKKYRFIGGFADPKSISFEADARREVSEEAGIEITDPQYVGSYLIDDWRYRSEVDKIKTTFFKANIMYGKPRAADDVCEVRWFDIDDLTPEQLVPEHGILLEALLKKGLDKSTKI
jgi:bifunctional NMN adenylyltransferase/nudix hydrolase